MAATLPPMRSSHDATGNMSGAIPKNTFNLTDHQGPVRKPDPVGSAESQAGGRPPGRIVAVYYCAPTSYQISLTYSNPTCRPPPQTPSQAAEVAAPENLFSAAHNGMGTHSQRRKDRQWTRRAVVPSAPSSAMANNFLLQGIEHSIVHDYCSLDRTR
jgi:hypothetical protein